MSLRKTVFFRTLLILGALIFLCNLAMAVFVVRQNREEWKRLGKSEAVFIADQAVRLLLWDDRVALHELIDERTHLNGQIEQIFVAVGGAPYVYTSPSGVPAGLLSHRGQLPGSASVLEVRDGRGRVFYDIAAKVGETDSVVHLLLSRKKVDKESLGLVMAISAICFAGWLLSLLPAWLSARAITSEADMATQDLKNLNDQLETRISERTAELSTANEKLKSEIAERERLEREKDDFYAMVTHDLKSPIAVITGYADLIREMGSGLSIDAIEMLGHIKQSSEKLSGIVNEFLTVSRLERGALALNISANDLACLVRETIKDCAHMCQDKNITISEELEEDLPMVLMDRFYVQRAVSNLVQNAVKFTPDGGRVLVCVRRDGENDDCVMVSVADTGIGIPDDEQDKVFEKYYRSSTAIGSKGSGLGLAVVKAVAVAHGGSVELKSEVGKGSTFSFKLPITPRAVLEV